MFNKKSKMMIEVTEMKLELIEGSYADGCKRHW